MSSSFDNHLEVHNVAVQASEVKGKIVGGRPRMKMYLRGYLELKTFSGTEKTDCQNVARPRLVADCQWASFFAIANNSNNHNTKFKCIRRSG